MPISDIMNSGDLVRRVEELERRLREISSGRRLEDASIGARGLRLYGGGGLTIADGGTLRLRSAIGVSLAKFGPGSTGNPEWRLNYDDGGAALNLQGDAGTQHVTVWDLAGNIVFSTDALSRTGVARPYIPMRLVPSWDAQFEGTNPWPSTDAESPTRLLQGINPMWHPKVSIGVLTGSTGPAAHWSVEINGVTVIDDISGSDSLTVDVPGWGDDITPGDAVGIDVYGWLDTGPGRVWFQCDRLYGRQS